MQGHGSGPPGYPASQFRYGPRVPCLVISPYAKRAINKGFFSHTSIVKFCIRLFGLQPGTSPALAPGDQSGDMWECFDFASPPRLGIPPTTPA
jgi:phospholipase C